jgi:hypothetical protein
MNVKHSYVANKPLQQVLQTYGKKQSDISEGKGV